MSTSEFYTFFYFLWIFFCSDGLNGLRPAQHGTNARRRTEQEQTSLSSASKRRSEGERGTRGGIILGRGRSVKRRQAGEAPEWSIAAVAHGVAGANGAHGRACPARGTRALQCACPREEEAADRVGPGG